MELEKKCAKIFLNRDNKKPGAKMAVFSGWDFFLRLNVFGVFGRRPLATNGIRVKKEGELQTHETVI